MDWRRFTTDQTVEFMLNEAAPLREISPAVPTTTNLMGTGPGLDYRRFAPHLDLISWDSYPGARMRLTAPGTWITTAFRHDLMRSLKPDRPWLLMECSPSSGNWFDRMALKRPDMHRFEALQAVAHYRALWQAGISCDLIGLDDALDRYRLVVAPMTYSLRPGFAERVAEFVSAGGTFVATYLTGWVDENSLVYEGGFLGPLREVLGVWIEELDVRYPDEVNHVQMQSDLFEGRFAAVELCELVHPTTAEVVGVYTGDHQNPGDGVTEPGYGAEPQLRRRRVAAGCIFPAMNSLHATERKGGATWRSLCVPLRETLPPRRENSTLRLHAFGVSGSAGRYRAGGGA